MPVLRLTVVDKKLPLKEVTKEIYNNECIKYISFESNEELKNLYDNFKKEITEDWNKDDNEPISLDVNFPFIEKLDNDSPTYIFMSKLISLLEFQDVTNIRLNSICEINQNDWKLKTIYNLEYLVPEIDFFIMTQTMNQIIKQKRCI